MTYPLVQELAAEGIPVRLTRGVLGFSPQAFCKWQANPVTGREWTDAHLTNALVDAYDDDPEPPSRRAPSVACSDLVRGSSRPGPWPAPPPSVPRTPPGIRRPRTHSGRRQSGITPQSASVLVSGMDLG